MLKKKLNIFLFLISSLLTFELFSKFYLGLGDPPLTRTHETIEYEFLPNQKVKRFRKKNLIKTNSFGMRSENFSEDKSKLRIIIYGDSVVWGGSLIDQKDLSTEILKKLLNKKSNMFEVGNVSAGSWGPGNWLAHIKDRGIYSADLVILVISSHDWNDNPEYKPLNKRISPIKKPISASSELINRYTIPKLLKVFDSVSKAFYTTNNIETNISNESEDSEQIKNKGLLDLEEFIDATKSKGAELAILQYWDKEEFESKKPKIGNKLIKNILQNKKIIHIQTNDKFKLCSENSELLYIDSIHPSKFGQHCLGDALYEIIKLTKTYQNLNL
tara:strand:- start:332 stop:1318 length:987 start_codon:yes stop_codon:yes gene_type:complete